MCLLIACGCDLAEDTASSMAAVSMNAKQWAAFAFFKYGGEPRIVESSAGFNCEPLLVKRTMLMSLLSV